MNRFQPSRPSPALVISMLALIVAMGGTSYAAFSLPKNSVGAKQLKKGAVTTAKIANAAVTGSKVAKNTITGTNINLRTLGTVPSATNAGRAASANSATNAGHAASANSATNATNATNATHASNADSATTAATATALGSVAYGFNTDTVSACSASPCTPEQVGTGFAIATCPQGMVAIGGGGTTGNAGVELSGSFPFSEPGSSVPNAWEADANNFLQSASTVDSYVVCTAVKAVDNPSGV
jgi:hypothetical protein